MEGMVKKMYYKSHECQRYFFKMILSYTDGHHNQHTLFLICFLYLNCQLWPYQRQIPPFIELYFDKNGSLEFINASHNVVGVLQEELGRDEKHFLKLGTWSWENQHTAQNSDRELLNQHFPFHLRPERNTFGRGEERKGERGRKKRQEERMTWTGGGEDVERRKKMEAHGRRQ